jgi:carbon monoxide dehydrogenase subunit G
MAVEGSGGPGFVRGESGHHAQRTAGRHARELHRRRAGGGLIAGVGQRMLGGVAKMMADQFFNRMGELLQAPA